jgi:hypothetical protein
MTTGTSVSVLRNSTREVFGVALWVNLEESSMVLGLIWAGIGLIYLACVTKSFRNPVPQYDEDIA